MEESAENNAGKDEEVRGTEKGQESGIEKYSCGNKERNGHKNNIQLLMFWELFGPVKIYRYKNYQHFLLLFIKHYILYFITL